MKLLLIGNSVEDQISSGGYETINPGGIIYSTIGLTSFFQKEDELYLLTAISPESEKLFSSVYRKVNREYFRYIEQTPQIRLNIKEKSVQCDSYINITQSLDVKSVSNLNSFDGILVNMITGFDITLDDMINLRKNYSGIIYLDIHSLSRGLDENNHRELRLIPNVKDWIASVDIIQVNEKEIYSISNKNEEYEIAKEVLHAGAKLLIVTKGEAGASLFFLEREDLGTIYVKATNNNSLNKIGCGDIFGSTFFYFYIKEKDASKALKIANTSAGCVASYTSIENFRNLKDDTYFRLNKK